MATFSEAIKNLNTSMEEVNVNGSTNVSALADADKMKFLCDHKDQINRALDLAKVFTGAKGDKLLDTVKSVIGSLCP